MQNACKYISWCINACRKNKARRYVIPLLDSGERSRVNQSHVTPKIKTRSKPRLTTWTGSFEITVIGSLCLGKDALYHLTTPKACSNKSPCSLNRLQSWQSIPRGSSEIIVVLPEPFICQSGRCGLGHRPREVSRPCFFVPCSFFCSKIRWLFLWHTRSTAVQCLPGIITGVIKGWHKLKRKICEKHLQR